MKKIMFNDRYGLTAAVLKGRKTMTRRLVGNRMTADDIKAYLKGYTELANKAAPYKIGETVAVAQNYHDVYEELKRTHGSSSRVTREFFHKYVQGGRKPVSNKMFVRADVMPHQIRITDIKVERLQDISEEDCFKEGITPIKWRQYLKQDIYDLTPQKYIDHDAWTLPIFKEGILDPWADSHPDEFIADSPSTAFAVLFRKLMGVKWESNPYVFAYTFELVK